MTPINYQQYFYYDTMRIPQMKLYGKVIPRLDLMFWNDITDTMETNLYNLNITASHITKFGNNINKLNPNFEHFVSFINYGSIYLNSKQFNWKHKLELE